MHDLNADEPTEGGTPDAADEVEAVAALLGVVSAADQRVAALRGIAAAVRALAPVVDQ